MVIQKVRGSPGRARHGGGGASPRGALRLRRLRLRGAEAAAGATHDPRPAATRWGNGVEKQRKMLDFSKGF